MGKRETEENSKGRGISKIIKSGIEMYKCREGERERKTKNIEREQRRIYFLEGKEENIIGWKEIGRESRKVI
jgi:hypothetical protein